MHKASALTHFPCTKIEKKKIFATIAVVVHVVNEIASMISELLYANDLVLMSEAIE